MDVLSDPNLCAYIINQFEECIWIKEINKPDFLYISEEAERLWGRPAPAFVADPTLWPSIIHAEDKEQVAKSALHFSEHQAFTYIYRIITPEGAEKHIEESVRVYTSGGTPLLIGKSKSVPEERLHLLAEHNKFKALLNSSPDINLYIDTGGKILGFNRVAAGLARRFGQLALAEGDDFLEYAQLFFPGRIAEAAQSFRDACEGNIIKKEICAKYPLYPDVWLKVRYIPMRNGQEQIIGISFSAIDITREKNAEVHLVQQNTTLRNIAWLHAHQLRHPVANILGLAEILQGLAGDNQDMRQVLELLHASTYLLDQNIQKIVHLSEEFEDADNQVSIDKTKTPSTFVESEVRSE